MWMTDGKKHKIYYLEGKPYICCGEDMVLFYDDWEKTDDEWFSTSSWTPMKAILSDDGKYITLAMFITAELVDRYLEKGYVEA